MVKAAQTSEESIKNIIYQLYIVFRVLAGAKLRWIASLLDG